MDQHALETTRRSLHGIAEIVLAGPQYAQSQTIRLRVTADGFGTVDEPRLRVARLALVAAGLEVPLRGTCAELARAVGVEPRTLRDVYAGGPAFEPEDPVTVDPEAATTILGAFSTGDAALRAFAPDLEPVLWPEHFDVAITSDEINYGVSPGDAHLPAPYAYVGPWAPLQGGFWNTSFGAALPMTQIPDPAALVDFFTTGQRHAATDPPRT